MIRALAALVLLLAPTVVVAQAVPVVPESRAEISLTFAPVVKRAAPAVVNIHTRTRVVRRYDDPVFEMLFGRSRGAARDETSLGSGVIVDPDGIVVTNRHVVEGADEIVVALADRREFRAEVLLADRRSDLAVLRVEAERLPSLAFREADTLEVGDLVLAIGNPFGVGQTVTSGIISAQARTHGGGEVFLQTDAAINPGNSGGALVDTAGRLVGINTMILSRSGGSNGIGFAIPADIARRVVEAARQGEARVARPWLGVEGQPVTQAIAESLGLARPEGVILSELHPASAFALAGLRAGDVVLSVEGRPVADVPSLAYRFGAVPLGGSARIGYRRDGEAADVSVAAVLPPEDPPRDTSEIGGDNPLAGLVVANLSPALTAETGLQGEGVVVLEVAGGFARRYGLRRGDRIVSINGVRIERVADVAPALDAAGRRWRILIGRGTRTIRLAVSG